MVHAISLFRMAALSIAACAAAAVPAASQDVGVERAPADRFQVSCGLSHIALEASARVFAAPKALAEASVPVGPGYSLVPDRLVDTPDGRYLSGSLFNGRGARLHAGDARFDRGRVHAPADEWDCVVYVNGSPSSESVEAVLATDTFLSAPSIELWFKGRWLDVEAARFVGHNPSATPRSITTERLSDNAARTGYDAATGAFDGALLTEPHLPRYLSAGVFPDIATGGLSSSAQAGTRIRKGGTIFDLRWLGQWGEAIDEQTRADALRLQRDVAQGVKLSGEDAAASAGRISGWLQRTRCFRDPAQERMSAGSVCRGLAWDTARGDVFAYSYRSELEPVAALGQSRVRIAHVSRYLDTLR